MLPRFVTIILALLLAFAVIPANTALAQEADVGAVQKKDEPAHPALRGFAEGGMGILFGTLAGGTALVTSLFVNPYDLKPAFISSAILYPTGLACGAILGGYLTDSKSGYWEPFVGAFSGALIADVTAYFLADDYPVFSAVLVIALPIVTTLLAMETSHAWRDREDKRKSETSTTVMPLSFGFAF